jgi:hypothetical protein
MDSPKIPTLKDSQKPQVKIRGLQAGATFVERLKQFRKKDLAFILAGLGTLLMAPLAEHFLMSPETGDSTLSQGFGGRGSGGCGLFGAGSSPYETGLGGMAPGGAIGGGADTITPLNVRDPSALVMGPGASQQPPAGSAAPATAPATAPGKSESDYKDALAASARGATEGVKRAMPKVPLAGSGLRGLGVSAGGSSATAGLAPISSGGLAPGRVNAGGGGLNNVRSMPGYRGLAVSRGPGQGGSGMEALRKAAEGAGEIMNRGAASTALDAAANAAIPAGGLAAGGASGSMSPNDKAAAAAQDKNTRSIGESLEFLKQKQLQEKRIELWAKEQEEHDFYLQSRKWINKAGDQFVGEVGKQAAVCFTNEMKGMDCNPAAPPDWYSCAKPQRDIRGSDVVDACTEDKGDQQRQISGKYQKMEQVAASDGTKMFTLSLCGAPTNSSEFTYRDCRTIGGGAGAGKKSTSDDTSKAITGSFGLSPSDMANLADLKLMCMEIENALKPKTGGATYDDDSQKWLKDAQKLGRGIGQIDDALSPSGKDQGRCGGGAASSASTNMGFWGHFENTVKGLHQSLVIVKDNSKSVVVPDGIKLKMSDVEAGSQGMKKTLESVANISLTKLGDIPGKSNSKAKDTMTLGSDAKSQKAFTQLKDRMNQNMDIVSKSLDSAKKANTTADNLKKEIEKVVSDQGTYPTLVGVNKSYAEIEAQLKTLGLNAPSPRKEAANKAGEDVVKAAIAKSQTDNDGLKTAAEKLKSNPADVATKETAQNMWNSTYLSVGDAQDKHSDFAQLLMDNLKVDAGQYGGGIVFDAPTPAAAASAPATDKAAK